MSEEPTLDDKVKTWLEVSGRALEMRIARSCLRAKADRVEQSFHYEDVVTKKSREGDVRAHWGWQGPQNTDCAIAAIVECKSSKDKPWVAIFDHNDMPPKPELEQLVPYALEPWNGVFAGVADVWAGRTPFQDAQHATHIVTAWVGDKDDKKPNHADESVQQVMSAVRAERQRRVGGGGTKAGVVIMGIVVTAAPLYTAVLDDQGETVLTSVASVVVNTSENPKQPLPVHVVREPLFGAFAGSLKRAADEAGLRAGRYS